MAIRNYRRAFFVDDGNGEYPPQLERHAEKSYIHMELDGERNLVMDSDVNGKTIIFHVPIEAIIDLINTHAIFVNNKNKISKKKKNG